MNIRIVTARQCIFHVALRESPPDSPAGYISVYVLGQSTADDVTLEACESCADTYERVVKHHNSNVERLEKS